MYNALVEPLSRDLLSHVQQVHPSEPLFRYLNDRSNIRQITGRGLKPAYVQPTDPVVLDVS